MTYEKKTVPKRRPFHKKIPFTPVMLQLAVFIVVDGPDAFRLQSEVNIICPPKSVLNGSFNFFQYFEGGKWKKKRWMSRGEKREREFRCSQI